MINIQIWLMKLFDNPSGLEATLHLLNVKHDSLSTIAKKRGTT